MARTDPKVSHTTAVNIWALFLRQPQQRSSCCRQAMWLYQGWTIRGWNNAAGASRIKALFEAVPKGQWIPLDMDIKGIWRYFGNYSFFGAPFIWTTLHNMVSANARARARVQVRAHVRRLGRLWPHHHHGFVPYLLNPV